MAALRPLFFLLVLANLLFFAWGQGYFGGRDEGREPQRLLDQLQADKLKVAMPAKAEAAPPPQGCRRIEGLAPVDAASLQKAIQAAGLTVAVALAEEPPGYWVHIPALPNKAAADKKAGELRLFGVTDFHVLQADGGTFAISFGVFRGEAEANEFLQGLVKKGVRSARVETKPAAPAKASLEVRAAADLLAKRLPGIVAGTVGAVAADCP